MAPNLIITSGHRDGAILAARDPDALVANVALRTLRRGLASVRVQRNVFMFAVAVAARPGAVIRAAELGDALYGDDLEGGPESLDCALRHTAYMAKSALLALGYRLEVNNGRGWSVRLVRTWSEAA